jgi:hypothetical protein
MIWCSNPSSGKRFFSSPKHPYWLWDPCGLLFNGYEGLFASKESGQDMRLTTHIRPLLTFRMRKILLPGPLYAFMACTGTTSLFAFTD